MVKFLILEALGIPRIRGVGDISIFNIIGTILFSWPLTLGLRFIELFEHIEIFQTACLLLVIAPLVHYLIGDHTPMVRLIVEKKEWKGFIILNTMVGINGSYVLLLFLIIYSILLFGQNCIKALFNYQGYVQ